MARKNPLYSALKRLREADGNLPASALTPRQKQELDLFGQQTRSVQRVASGRGDSFRIVESTVVEKHWQALCPSELEALSDLLPDRAKNIAGYRDSKLGTTRHEQTAVLLKATANEPITWYNGEAQLDLNKATQDFGAAALALMAEDRWLSDQPLWLIENQLLFDRTDWFPANEAPASLLYYAGQVPNLLIDWLATTQRTPDLVLFPDYDGVGFLNFARLHTRLEGRCRFWLMPNWRDRLASFGNTELWRKTRGDFEQAYATLSSPLAHSYKNSSQEQVLDLMHAMRHQGLALEQESVWLEGATK